MTSFCTCSTRKSNSCKIFTSPEVAKLSSESESKIDKITNMFLWCNQYALLRGLINFMSFNNAWRKHFSQKRWMKAIILIYWVLGRVRYELTTRAKYLWPFQKILKNYLRLTADLFFYVNLIAKRRWKYIFTSFAKCPQIFRCHALLKLSLF